MVSLSPSPPPPLSSQSPSLGRTIGPPVAWQWLGQKDVALTDCHGRRPIKSWHYPRSCSEWHIAVSASYLNHETHWVEQSDVAHAWQRGELFWIQVKFLFKFVPSRLRHTQLWNIKWGKADWKSGITDFLLAFTVRNDKKENMILITILHLEIHYYN